MPEVYITIQVDGTEQAAKLAMAVVLLRYYGQTYGDDQALRMADEAGEALQELSVQISEE